MTFTADRDEHLALLSRMSAQEKIELLNGNGLWKTNANYRLNIPEIVMTDGPHGVRYSITQIENKSDELGNLKDFLAIVNQTANGRGNATVGLTRPSTCFPNGCLTGCSWDIELTRKFGETLAVECHHFGINLLLGPGINIRRTPLAGRSYEYYSEDPVLTGDLAAAFINGLQDNGVGAALKHFACNNSEIERTTMSSEVDERALREIYLAGFERAIAKSLPWTIMTSYNVVNGEQASSSPTLISEILRGDWGYEGVVMSDWHGIKDRPASLAAGNDLDMPESRLRRAAALSALQSGSLAEDAVDRSVKRHLELVAKAKAGEREVDCDFDEHHELARRVAAESIVLLKNRESTLPISVARHPNILVIGQEAVEPSIQGAGSATINPTKVDIPLDEIVKLAGPKANVRHMRGPEGLSDRASIDEAVAAARESDSVIVFAGTISGADGESSDRKDLSLAPGQDELITSLSSTARRIIVILTMPDAVEMPWAGQVDAILAAFFPGQGGGHALARLLFGLENPSGKLSVTFPQKLGDVPGIHTYPGENDLHTYSESIFVGYRSYDLRAMEPLFPFGHGLSYTTFQYSDIEADAVEIRPGTSIRVSLAVRNTGKRTGREIVQLYVAPGASGMRRPRRELKAFAKLVLEPDESKRVDFVLEPRDFMHYDPVAARWQLEAEAFTIEAAASSRDIRCSITVPCRSDRLRSRRLTSDTQPKFVIENPKAAAAVCGLLSKRLGITREEALSVLNLTKYWFLGIHQSLAWYVGDQLPAAELDSVLKAAADDEEPTVGVVGP